MLYKIGKKLFELLRNVLHFTQVVLVFLCFFIVLYWILQIAQVTWIEPVAPFFEAVKNFTHIFYNRTSTIDNIELDFSFLIATLTILLIVWGLKPLIEQIEILEEKYDLTYRAIKKRVEDNFNTSLEKEYIKDEYKNSKFLILVKFNSEDLSVDNFYGRNEDKRVSRDTQIMSDFMEVVSEDLPCTKKLLEDNLLLYFNDFEKIEETIDKLKLTIKELKNKYVMEKWKIKAFVSVETYAKASEIVQKVQKLLLMNKLGLSDCIICLSSFKQRYALFKEKKFRIEIEGSYKLGENEEEVSIIKT